MSIHHIIIFEKILALKPEFSLKISENTGQTSHKDSSRMFSYRYDSISLCMTFMKHDIECDHNYEIGEISILIDKEWIDLFLKGELITNEEFKTLIVEYLSDTGFFLKHYPQIKFD